MFIRFAQTSKDEKKRCIGFELSFDQSCLDYDGLSLMYFLFSHHFSSFKYLYHKSTKKLFNTCLEKPKGQIGFIGFCFSFLRILRF